MPRKWDVCLTNKENEEIKRQAGISTHVWSQWVTKICAGNLLINAIITHFRKSLFSSHKTPHINTRSSLNAVQLKPRHSTFLLAYLLLWEGTRGVRRHLFLFHKEKPSNFSKLATTFLPFCLSSYFKFRPLVYDSLSANLWGANKA